ncbi:MAG TPA: hypothetical protein VF600_08500 [Abditibacteriaceae bacterium]|jgi:hypothetical protein
MKIKDIFLSADFIGAVAIAIALTGLLPTHLDNDFAKDFYSIGISVLSIVFSVFFAALAVIISASDNDFVMFLEEDGSYSNLIKVFRFTLGILFVALLYSVALYGLTAVWITSKGETQGKWWFITFCFLFLYSLFSAYNSTYDSINYAKFRAIYLKQQKQDRNTNSET